MICCSCKINGYAKKGAKCSTDLQNTCAIMDKVLNVTWCCYAVSKNAFLIYCPTVH